MTLCDGWSSHICGLYKSCVSIKDSGLGAFFFYLCVIRTGPVKLINQTETRRDRRERETLIYADTERQRDQACRVTLIWPAPSPVVAIERI